MLTAASMVAGALPAPSHERPYFMPDQRRQEILKLVQDAPWAKEAYAKAKAATEQVDNNRSRRGDEPDRTGYWAAFLYALEGDQKHLDIAQKWLLKGWGLEARETIRKKKLLDTAENWKGPENSVDWYLLDYEGYVAFDWVYRGLPAEARQNIHDGLAIQTRYRMACMDSWGSTPNLNFKPISMATLGALTLQDEDLMRWAFERTEHQGNYLSMMDRMIRGGGPWHEAPIYAIAHKDLWCMSMIALYGGLLDGKDWYSTVLPGGGSPRKLMDYYIDTAYPIERMAEGRTRVRIATYGDGSTGVTGGNSDHFMSHLNTELALAYAITGDESYAPFLAMQRDYQPNLWDHRPLPQGEARYPAAPSKIWPMFGLAMLRSDESPAYWTNPNAIAVLEVLTQGYGHDHRDKFGITLFGANRLLYPDYLGIQYEALAMGWTNTPVCHNEMMVDEQDTRNAPPSIRNDFTPEVKFLATSASGVFEGVAQTRALMLTSECLLDLFAASSKVPHTYDYILNSLGMPQPGQGVDLPSAPAISPRYWALEETRTGTSSSPWSLDFVLKEEQHEAKVRMTMAADRDTRIGCGMWGPNKFAERAKEIHGLRDIQGRWKEGTPHLGQLVARREGRRSTVFAAAHEPYANAAVPKVRTVTRLAETPEAIVVRVDGDGFTDYAAVAWGDDAQSPLRVLASSDDPKQVFAFRNYGYLRVMPDGAVVARGGWSGLRIPTAQAHGRLLLNGKQQQAVLETGYLTYGELPQPQTAVVDPESPFPLTPTPSLARLLKPGKTQVRIGMTNTLKEPVSGSLDFELPAGISAGEQPPTFGPVRPGESIAIPVTFTVADEAVTGRRTLPFRLRYRVGSSADEVRTQYLPLMATVGTSVRADHTQGEILVDTPGYTLRLNSRDITTMYLADPDGTVRLNGSPLFTFTNEEGKPVLSEGGGGGVWLGAEGVTQFHGTYCRFATQYLADRIRLPYGNRTYTRIKEAHFTIPGNWISPAGPPRWKRIIAVDDQGKESDVPPGQDAKIVAAELEFPQSAWNIALMFTPARNVKLDGLKVQFVTPIREPETWSLGFCKPGTLDEWRQRSKP